MPRSAPPDRFEHLISAGTLVFIQRGYRQAQMADVATVMGVAKGTVYLYVTSKEALFDQCIRLADAPRPLVAPAQLPVPAPALDTTAGWIREQLEAAGQLPALAAAEAKRPRGISGPAELGGIIGEWFDMLVAHRRAIALLDRCSRDWPELGALWLDGTRARAIHRLAAFLDDRMRVGRLRRVPDVLLAARAAVETLAFLAMHRLGDPFPVQVDDATARATAIDLIMGTFTPEAS